MILSKIENVKPEQQPNNDSTADNSQVSPLAQNRLLSAAFSVEGNKLIATYMEINVTDFVWNEHLGLVYCDEHGDFQIDEDLQYYSPDTRWNDLMPVIKKINGGYHHTSMLWRDITIALIDVDILKTWNAVIAYIKWFHLTDKSYAGSR